VLIEAPNIEIVCRLNQARSQFLAAFVRNHFPNVVISSSGVDANLYNSTDSKVMGIATSWGFSLLSEKCSKTRYLPDTRYYPVDDVVENRLQIEGYTDQIISQSSLPIDLIFRKPRDPILISLEKMKIELALLLVMGIHHLRFALNLEYTHPIKLLRLPNKKEDSKFFEDSIDHVLGEHHYIVNANLKDIQVNRNLEAKYSTLPLLEYRTDSAVFSPKFESLNPEKVLCSTEWRMWLMWLSKQGPVCILTPAVTLSDNSPNLDSILASIWAGASQD